MAESQEARSPDITVYRGFPQQGEYIWSPFVTKLEARLRFAGIPYKTAAGSPRSAPRGKIPYITYALPTTAMDGMELMSDSTLIARELVSVDILPDINASLSAADRARDLAIRALLEEKLYFFNTWERWVQNYYTMRDHVLAPIPYPLRVLVGMLAYRANVRTFHGQGAGRFTPREIATFREEIWNGVEALLAEAKAKATTEKGPFFVLGGKQPTEADCVVYSFINSVLVCTAGPASRQLVRSLPTVVEYARRIHDKYFPDYKLWERWE